MTPDAMRRAQASATASISQMSNNPNLNLKNVKRQPIETPVSMGKTRPKPAPIKVPPPEAPPKAPIKKTFMSGKGLAIGAGAAVIAGLAMNRRGDGTSSGRAGMTRY
jgi:hypothetical protein